MPRLSSKISNRTEPNFSNLGKFRKISQYDEMHYDRHRILNEIYYK